MLTAALLLVSCAGRTAPSPQALGIEALDRMAQARDVSGLQALTSPDAPISVLRTNGAYDAGRFGWHAVEMRPKNGRRYVVLSTPLTGEDIGELLFVERDGKLEYIPETTSFGFSVVREDLAATFDLPNKTVSIVAKVQLGTTPRPETPGFTGVQDNRGAFLRLGPNFRVATIKDAQGASVDFRQAGGVVYVDTPFAPTTLTISYSGVVDRPQFAGSIDDRHIQLTNEFWYPGIARQPAPYTLMATIPKDWVAVGQGEPIQRDGDGKARFDMTLPTSVWSFSAEPFKTFSRKDAAGRVYDVYSSRLTPEQMRRQTELFEPILDFYGRSFAPYPFSHWGAADVKTYGGGALEAYSYATYGYGFLPDEDAHEPSHTWWGGILPNTYLRSFWNESFAVWSEGLYQRNVPIGNVAARREAFADLAEAEGSYDRVPVASGSCFIGPEASSLGYGKGGHVLAMLEQLVGTEALLAGCREWIRTHPKGQPADWEEFEATMIRLNPKLDLKSFFDDWLRKRGSAEVSVEALSWKDRKLVGRMSSKPWRMPLEFVLVAPDGKIERRTLDTRDVSANGDFELSSGLVKPARVLFDPYHRALRRGDPAPSTGFFSSTRGFRVYRDPKTPDYLRVGQASLASVPSDLDRVVLIGHPRSTPAMLPLLTKAGMKVTGDTLVWGKTTVDLNRGGAIALVDLGVGKTCALVLGTAAAQPNVGRAATALFDGYGRFLDGRTPLPRTREGVFEIR